MMNGKEAGEPQQLPPVDDILAKYFRGKNHTTPLNAASLEQSDDLVRTLLGDYVKAKEKLNNKEKKKNEKDDSKALEELETALVGMIQGLHTVLIEHKKLLEKDEGRKNGSKEETQPTADARKDCEKETETIIKKGNVIEMVRKKEEEAKRMEEEWKERQMKWIRDREKARAKAEAAIAAGLVDINHNKEGAIQEAPSDKGTHHHHFHLSGVMWHDENHNPAGGVRSGDHSDDHGDANPLSETKEERERRAKIEEEESLRLLREWRAKEKDRKDKEGVKEEEADEKDSAPAAAKAEGGGAGESAAPQETGEGVDGWKTLYTVEGTLTTTPAVSRSDDTTPTWSRLETNKEKETVHKAETFTAAKLNELRKQKKEKAGSKRNSAEAPTPEIGESRKRDSKGEGGGSSKTPPKKKRDTIPPVAHTANSGSNNNTPINSPSSASKNSQQQEEDRKNEKASLIKSISLRRRAKTSDPKKKGSGKGKANTDPQGQLSTPESPENTHTPKAKDKQQQPQQQKETKDKETNSELPRLRFDLAEAGTVDENAAPMSSRPSRSKKARDSNGDEEDTSPQEGGDEGHKKLMRSVSDSRLQEIEKEVKKTPRTEEKEKDGKEASHTTREERRHHTFREKKEAIKKKRQERKETKEREKKRKSYQKEMESNRWSSSSEPVSDGISDVVLNDNDFYHFNIYFTAKKHEDAVRLHHEMQRWLEEQEKQHKGDAMSAVWVTSPKVIVNAKGSFDLNLG